MSAPERRPGIVKVKDLKPKRIKDYLEYKFSRRSPTLLKNEVNTVPVRDQKHELTPPRNRYPCDNGYKEVTVLPSRDIVYDQVKQLIGLRHKPITLQDALPRSDSQPRFSTCLCSRHPLCHHVQAEYRSPSMEEVQALTVDPEAIID
ncbi:hypothetical protein GQ457_03G015770 [Hibiscus cannabinus]